MFPFRRKPLPILATSMVCALLLGGCGSGSGNSDSASSTSRPSAASTSTPPTTSGSSTPPTHTITPTTPTTAARPPATTAAPTTTSGPTTTPAPATTAAPTTTAAPLPKETGDLAGGSKGSRTEAVQVALHDQMYDPGRADGSFGLKTSEAVWAWQALHNLPRTGVVTADMERLILARGTQPMLRPDLGPTHSEVDLARQVLLVFRAGKVALITHVSTGSGRHYCNKGSCGTAITGTGSFHFQRRIKGWRHAPLGLLYNPVYFNGGIAVHGEPSVPNYPASHGCVRIPMHIAEYFPGLVAKGDPIVVI